MRKKLKILGVCAAQGPLLFPLRRENLLGNVEPRGVFHTKGEEQWKLNFGNVPFVKKLEDIKVKNVDVIVGSPSCGHSSVFSYSRKKKLGDPRVDPSMNLFISAIKTVKPKVFMMENLPKMLEIIPITDWITNFEEYEIITLCYTMNYFGNSQTTRKRMLLIGVKKGTEFKMKQFARVFPVNTPKTYGELIENLDTKKNYVEGYDVRMAMYDYRDSSKKTLTVREIHELWTNDFSDYYKWPMIGTKMKTLPGVYRNKYDSFPMTARPSSRQFSPFGWPMGLEEYKLIMGFPKRFKIYFDKEKPTYWLNKGRNTITKGVVYEVAKWFKKCLLSNFQSNSCN